MNCPKCGRDNNDKLKFCQGCGENLQKIREAQMLICPECGEKNEGDVSFCGGCGFSFAAMKAAQARRAADEKMLGFDLSSFGGLAVDANAATGDFDLDALSQTADAFGSQAIANQKKEATERALADFEYVIQGNGKYVITKLKNRSVLNVDIPEGVETISDGVFEGSNVFSVRLPEGLMQIGSRAFRNCKNLSEINLPKTIILIGDEAFANCESLEIEIPASIRRVGRDVIANTLTDRRAIKEAEARRLAKEAAEREAARIAAEKKAEAERLAREAQERKKAEEAAERERRNLAEAAELDRLLAELDTNDATRAWCDQVKALISRIESTDSAVRNKMKNSYLMTQHTARAELLRRCFAVSDTIGKLAYAKQHDRAWANDVFNTISSVTADMRPYVLDFAKLEALLPEAHKILRKPTVDEYKSCLESLERGTFGGYMDKYDKLNSRLHTLDYGMELYIPSFKSRWKDAKQAIANEKDRIAKAEADAERRRREKEAKEAEEKRIAEAEAAEKARREAIKNNVLATVIPIIIVAATVFASIILNNSISGDWKKWLILTAISIGYAGVILTFRIFKGRPAIFIHLYISIPAVITAIVFLFISSLRLVTLYICAPIFLAAISRWIYFFITSEYDDDDYDDDENATLNITALTAFAAIAISMLALAIQLGEVENASMIVLMCGMALITIVNFMHIGIYGESVGLLSLIATIGSAIVFFMPFFTNITSTAVYVLSFVVPGLTFFANGGICLYALTDGDL